MHRALFCLSFLGEILFFLSRVKQQKKCERTLYMWKGTKISVVASNLISREPSEVFIHTHTRSLGLAQLSYDYFRDTKTRILRWLSVTFYLESNECETTRTQESAVDNFFLFLQWEVYVPRIILFFFLQIKKKKQNELFWCEGKY